MDWNPDADVFVCPCHDSQFNLDGTVARPPTYVRAKVEGDIVLVNVS